MIDYSRIGLKAGLEIHQQLNTRKLFCNCPSEIREDSPDFFVKRVLRASAGESGTIDVAAFEESKKGKYFIYQYYNDTTCLVELDEEPPHDINSEALNIVLQLAHMMNCDIVDQVHVMRKTVVDGSNTSGFQRTALIARNGFIEVESEGKLKTIKIDTLCLEEDAARIISRNDDHDVYRLDRLGIPLIEIATGPDMNTPQEVKDTAAFIGMMLRSTGKVKRGLGTIRQDVNVSIDNGARVEIKGVQDLKIIDKVVELEAIRQLNLIKLRDEIILRLKGEELKNIISSEIFDLTEYFSETSSSLIRKNLDLGLRVYGKYYKKFKGFFGFEINPNRRFGSELSDRIKIFGINGLIHSDENLDKYKISGEIKNIYSDLGLNNEDSIILIMTRKEKSIMAFQKIDETITNFYSFGLSKEVRNAKDDGTSNFLRVMPGSSRMYPETDVKKIIPDIKGFELPELIKDKILRFEKEYSLPKQVAKEVVLEDKFEFYVKKYPQVKPVTIADVLVSSPKEVKTRFNLDIDVDSEKFSNLIEEILLRLNNGELAKEAVIEIMVEYAKGLSIDFSKYKTSEEELIKYIVELISKNPNLKIAAIMGEVMKKYRGKYPGSRIMELVKKYKGE
ncbi:MAG: glutamyl-tRNA(Gln) amidotransferase subunit E [Candidatus Woesearchaeota archaeon]|nr:MAG: glutamyl-tRNA(Gln) amidotransferase subunit E [Candidatus Woesearchaeota archaeon]